MLPVNRSDIDVMRLDLRVASSAIGAREIMPVLFGCDQRTTASSAPRRTGEPLFDAIGNIVNKATKSGGEAVELTVEVTQRQQPFLIDSHQC
jgi:hypothetical protein